MAASHSSWGQLSGHLIWQRKQIMAPPLETQMLHIMELVSFVSNSRGFIMTYWWLFAEEQLDGGPTPIQYQAGPAVYAAPVVYGPQPLHEPQAPVVIIQERDYIEDDSCLPFCAWWVFELCRRSNYLVYYGDYSLVGCWTALLLSPWCLSIWYVGYFCLSS